MHLVFHCIWFTSPAFALHLVGFASLAATLHLIVCSNLYIAFGCLFQPLHCIWLFVPAFTLHLIVCSSLYIAFGCLFKPLHCIWLFVPASSLHLLVFLQLLQWIWLFFLQLPSCSKFEDCPDGGFFTCYCIVSLKTAWGSGSRILNYIVACQRLTN